MALAQAAPDAILGISDAFKKDTDPRRMNLGVGAHSPHCCPEERPVPAHCLVLRRGLPTDGWLCRQALTARKKASR